jgi:hypothetical protein
MSLAAVAPAATQANVENVTVYLDSSIPTEIAPNFVGFSIEVGGVLGMIGEKGSSTPFAQMLRNLYELTPSPHPGPVMRLGGNSADGSCFKTNQTLPPQCKYVITGQDLAAYKVFASNTANDCNVSYVIDTNFGLSPDPGDVAVAHVRAITKAGLWPLVHAIEIGNEIDIFAKGTPEEQKEKGHRNSSYDYGYYEPEFASYLAAYRQPENGMPPKIVQGATYCSFSNNPNGRAYSFKSNVSRYLDRFGPKGAQELKTFSYHRYPISHCGGSNVTQADLLADRSVVSQVAGLAPIIAACEDRGVPFWIGEGNSCSCGGMPGVSDTFTAALWVGDFLASMSKAGVAGMNFHGGPRGTYPAVAFDSKTGALEVRPLYYGLLQFSELVANYSSWLATNTTFSSSPERTEGKATRVDNPDPTCQHGILSKLGDGREVCCAASCGSCGGTGCNDRPGGGAACCGGTISKDGRSCDARYKSWHVLFFSFFKRTFQYRAVV